MFLCPGLASSAPARQFSDLGKGAVGILMKYEEMWWKMIKNNEKSWNFMKNVNNTWKFHQNMFLTWSFVCCARFFAKVWSFMFEFLCFWCGVIHHCCFMGEYLGYEWSVSGGICMVSREMRQKNVSKGRNLEFRWVVHTFRIIC